ncbi:hypothetical protein P691DRAFT_791118 [Macrolepiota fuliginosa MF-IS2]|uniref:Uncharacterized protein n=1 Tax=Macrolepiota fuliginosa MF-IS2 TaxID=1400762 RepID=A0A9P5X1G3_9AGAR|nr:hypothetical protein P691DRAFT_791118 [Macrolepiota fuliginosa MF-IS2]
MHDSEGSRSTPGGQQDQSSRRIPDRSILLKLPHHGNQIALFCAASGVVTDQQKIICALTCLCAPASTYMKDYFAKVQNGQGLGNWDDFTKELKNIYGQRDDKEGAKKELTAIWTNKELAKKNFVKFYANMYRVNTCNEEVKNNAIIITLYFLPHLNHHLNCQHLLLLPHPLLNPPSFLIQ